VLGLGLFAQIILGIYLKLHIERGVLGRIRPWLVTSHGVLGKTIPIAAWVQMLFGGITALGFCRDDHLGQCLAHFIMGSAFIAYGIILTLLLLVGQFWLRRTGRSQEFFDSAIIAAWGCVNTFTEHRWGGPWVRNDLQHTSMGIIWWAAGLMGMWLSRRRDGTPKRNVVPGVVLILTGYGMSAHPQELMLSTMIHQFFGYTLMLAGLTRIIEVSFILRDRSNVSMDGSNPHSFQYVPCFVSYSFLEPRTRGAHLSELTTFGGLNSCFTPRGSCSWAPRRSRWRCSRPPASRTCRTSSSSTASLSYYSYVSFSHLPTNAYIPTLLTLTQSSTSSCICTPCTPSPPARRARRLSTAAPAATAKTTTKSMTLRAAPTGTSSK